MNLKEMILRGHEVIQERRDTNPGHLSEDFLQGFEEGVAELIAAIHGTAAADVLELLNRPCLDDMDEVLQSELMGLLNRNPITYQELHDAIALMTPEQREAHVTVEDSAENECYQAELRITGEDHDSLDADHPVIYIPMGVQFILRLDA